MRFLFGVLIFSFVACGQASPLPDMEPGERGRVVRVIDGDALVLNTGQSVRLVGIEAPALRPRGRDPETYAAEASRALENMVLGREVQLYYPGLTRDRYDRALAHVVTTDTAGPSYWLNMDLVSRGAARVRLYPDTAARGEALLAAEAKARAGEIGLWASPDYRVQEGAEISPESRGVMIIRAQLERQSPAQDAACVWSIRGAALSLVVEEAAAQLCNANQGDRYRVRGWVSGERLMLSHPLHAERLE